LIKGLGPGGAERLLVSLAAGRDRARVHYDAAYVLPWKQHFVGALEAEGVTTTLLAGRRGLGDPRWPLHLRRLVRAGQYDVVHTHSPAVASVVRPIVRTLRPRPMSVHTEHNVWSSFGPPSRVANGITTASDDHRIAVSEQVQLSMWKPWRERSEVIVHGVPVATLQHAAHRRAAARVSIGAADDEIVVGIVANLRANKDYPTLLDAAVAAVGEEPRLRFVSVGQGPLEAELRARATALGLGDRFTFLGYHEDPASVLAGCDVFTLSSRYEGLSIALLEAMALGLPCVVTDAGASGTVVRDGVEGIVVVPGNSGALARAYVSLAAQPDERKRLGVNAAARSVDYDIAHAIRRTEAIYHDLAARRRTRR
jgi:glycosyltransferase involved in cell wall biosynthesis